MRYPASEKLEIIRLVEQSHLPTKQTIDRLGIPRTTFYRWYDKYLTGGIAKVYPGYLADKIRQADKKTEPERSAAIEKLRGSVVDEMREDISRYRQAARELQIVRDRLAAQNIEPTCDGVHVTISLKFNHLINGFAHLHHLDSLQEQLDLFGM